MMQQPVMAPQDINIALGQLEAQAGQLEAQTGQLEALQEAQAAGIIMPQQTMPQQAAPPIAPMQYSPFPLGPMMPQQVAPPIAPMQYSPFPMQAMQQRRPPGSHLLVGAVVMAGLYLLNRSYKLDIQKRPDNTDRIDEL